MGALSWRSRMLTAMRGLTGVAGGGRRLIGLAGIDGFRRALCQGSRRMAVSSLADVPDTMPMRAMTVAQGD